jgi:phosphate transport system protein
MPRDALHQELAEIEEAVIQMAGLVESAVARGMRALSTRDSLLVEEVIAGDQAINDFQRNIRNRCISVMARQQPVARDLRELATVQLVISELARMGDHAAGIAKQVKRMSGSPMQPELGDLEEIATLVREQVRNGIQAFVDVNVQQAREVCERDDEIDHRYKQVFARLLDHMRQQPEAVQDATSLLFVAHDLERIGDRVTNICEDVVYQVTGEIEELN